MFCILNLFNLSMTVHKTIPVVAIFSLVSSIFLIGTFSSYSFASTAEEVSENEISNDGWDIVGYCYDSLIANYFEPGYTRTDCDNSMLFYSEYCNEKAFYPEGNICTSQRVGDQVNYYIQQRGIEGESSLGYYYDIDFK